MIIEVLDGLGATGDVGNARGHTERETTRAEQWRGYLLDAATILPCDSVAPDVGNVSLTIAIRSPEDEQAVRGVYQAWQERCPVYLALTKALSVATTLDIKRP